MPVTSRYEVGGNRGNARRPFRALPDDQRARGNNGHGNGGTVSRNNLKTTPPEVTNAENFYYLKQMSSKTPMVLVLADGEEIHGCIEWYDKSCLKVNRDGAPNLVIQKRYIKYLFKAEDRV